MKIRCLLIGLLLCAPAWALEPVRVIREVAGLVQQHFFDPTLRGLDWPALTRQSEAQPCQTWEELAKVVNAQLAHLHTSHTAYYSPQSRGYHDLNGVFASVTKRAEFIKESQYESIGVDVRDGFIIAILDGSPAQRAGLLVGDRILGVDGRPFHEILSFAGKRSARVRFQRTAAGAPQQLEVPVEHVVSDQAYLTALKKSCRAIGKVAYVHVWSYAGEQYQEALSDALGQAPLKDCTSLVLDVRDGWGGATPGYLNLFNHNVPESQMIDRNGKAVVIDQQWRKPVVLLVNGGSRSGKELLAYGFQRFHIGPVVGERTAGMVVGGRLYPLKSGGALYLAVADVLVEGKHLEGVGVEPDVRVARPIEYSQGADPQLQEAVRQAELLAAKL